MGPIAIVFIVLASIFAVILIVSLIVWQIAVAHFNNLSRAVRYSITNDDFCEPEKGACALVVDNTLTYPITPISTQFSYVVARYAADLIVRVQMLYKTTNPDMTLEMPDGMTLLTTLVYRHNIIGFIGLNDGLYWVAFRGTTTDKEWKKDLEFSLTDTNTTHSQRATNSQMMCHSGFLDIYDDFEQIIYDTIPQGSSVVVTGHSLGAGLATLTCINLTSTHDSVWLCICFPKGLFFYSKHQ